MNKHKLEKVNGRLVAIFLFQYSLIIPLTTYFSPSLMVASIGLLLLCIIFFLNHNNKFDTSILLFLLFISSVVGLKAFLSSDDYSLLFNFITIILPVLFLFLYRFDSVAFLETGYILALINFIINSHVPFTSNFNYMRFGYGMLLTPIFIYIRIRYYTKHKKFLIQFSNLLILLLSSIGILIFGARGAFFALLLFIFFDNFIINKKYILRNVFVLVICLVLYFLLPLVVDLIESILIKLDISSYAINKYKLQLSEGFAIASSGRSLLYQESIAMIRESSIFGNPIVIGEDDVYVHNLFLQVLQDFGIPVFILFIVILFVIISNMFRNRSSKEEKIIILIFFATSIGRLMFSSIYWRRPEFWMFLSYGILSINPKSYRQHCNLRHSQHSNFPD